MFTTLELGQRGRLGNQLFQVAAVIGASEKYGVPFELPEWYAGRFMAAFPFPALSRQEGWQDYRELFFHMGRYRRRPLVELRSKVISSRGGTSVIVWIGSGLS